MSSSLPLRKGAPPRPPLWPGGKPKAYFAVSVIVIAVGIAVAALGFIARPHQRSISPREAWVTGATMVVVGALLAVLSQRGKNRQRRARAALDAWAKANGFALAHPDVASGSWRGVPLSIRVAYGSARTQGDARAWLVEAGDAPRCGWVIVFDRLEDEAAIRERLGLMADAAVRSARMLSA